MNNHQNTIALSDSEFIQKLNDCSLNPKAFNHKAHLRLTYINLNEYGLDKAILITQNQLESFVTHLGASEKYDSVLSMKAVKIMNEFIIKSKSNSFNDLIKEFPILMKNFKSLIN